MLAWLIGTMAIAQDAEQPEEAKQPGIVSVDVGFDQNVKLGKWLPVSILVCDIQPTRFAITAPDGNGNQVKYSGELTQVVLPFFVEAIARYSIESQLLFGSRMSGIVGLA